MTDDRFEQAWRAVAQDEARVVAPAGLERRVLAAVTARPAARASHRDLLQWAGSLAAVVTLCIGGAWWLTRPGPADPPAAAAVAVPPAPVPPQEPAASVALLKAAPPQPKRAVPPSDEVPMILMTLDAEPMRSGEARQLVRLRLPREALQQFGVVLLEPDAGGMVDVDVLIGEDGLPREIRRVRMVQE